MSIYVHIHGCSYNLENGPSSTTNKRLRNPEVPSPMPMRQSRTPPAPTNLDFNAQNGGIQKMVGLMEKKTDDS